MKNSKIIFVFFAISLISLFSQPSEALTNVSVCGTLSFANEYYQLNQSISSSSTCITIGASNITLDGNGYTITYAYGTYGNGVDESAGGFNNITIKNLNVTQIGSLGNSHAIYLYNATIGFVFNNSISTYGTGSYGIALDANIFNFLVANNTIYTMDSTGILISYSDYNNFTNNTITANGLSYGFESSVSKYNNIFVNNHRLKAVA